MERKIKGFTIIELLVVIAIIAVLSAIAVPAALGWVKDAKVRDANEEARLVYSAVQDYITELEIKNVNLNASGTADEALMYSCSTNNSLPKPNIDKDGDGIPDSITRNIVAPYGAFTDPAVNGSVKDVAIDLTEALGEEFEGVWAAKINLNTYTVIEAYWTPYLEGSDPATPPEQKNVEAAEDFDSLSDVESFYADNGYVIGKYPI